MPIGRHLTLAVAVALTAGAASAEGPQATPRPRVGKVGLRVLQIFPESHQALVFDKTAGRHVVVVEGDRVGAFSIVEIDDDQVVVQLGTRELVLLVDAGTPATSATTTPVPAAPTGERTLLDPYAPTVIAAPTVAFTAAGPLDPYGPTMAPRSTPIGMLDPSTPVRVVSAPSGPRPTATPTTLDPYGVPASPVGATPPPKVSAPVVVAPPPPPVPTVEPIRVDALGLRRAELSAALADFDKLAKDLGFARTGAGVRLARVPTGSYFHGLGFRAGDVVTAIDGAPLRSLDDAAGVYVRLGSAKKLAVEIDRGGAHGTLRFALK